MRPLKALKRRPHARGKRKTQAAREGNLSSGELFVGYPLKIENTMRNMSMFAVAIFFLVSPPAFAQSTPAQPVMPAPRDYPNPNATLIPMNNGSMPEGRAIAPNGTMGGGVHRGKGHSGGK